MYAIFQICMAVFLPVLIIPKIGFITYEKNQQNPSSVEPSKSADKIPTEQKHNSKNSSDENQDNAGPFQFVSWFYGAPQVKFIFYMV